MEREHARHAPVTRMEILDAVADAFTHTSVSAEDLVAAARDSQARDAVIHTLQNLPERRFQHVRDIWEHLDVPVESA
ncbi:MAG: DUF2795 domain-containing protein [Rhodococcus sp. (in: high G+C Gram-positive bacteria)]|uniref:DUF2795 domain-containing protein n=1 Tax=Rhodococcus sp. TaxID=1831 RepID=UPI002AD68E67|nr:DUF2795 domain-containing protein [Rhodococcus sp. (in: high G+C Gram-positive bacteria)]